MVDTVHRITNNAIVRLFGDGVRHTTTYYMKTFDVKLSKGSSTKAASG